MSAQEQGIDTQTTGQILHYIIYNLRMYMSTRELRYFRDARKDMLSLKLTKGTEPEETKGTGITLGDIGPLM